MQSNSQRFRHLLPLYLACYLLWILISALGLGLVMLLRINLIDIVVALRLGPWVLGALDKFGIFILGLIWLACVVALESYLRNGIAKNLLWYRSGRVLLVEIVMIVISFGLQWLFGPMGPLGPGG